MVAYSTGLLCQGLGFVSFSQVESVTSIFERMVQNTQLIIPERWGINLYTVELPSDASNQ